MVRRLAFPAPERGGEAGVCGEGSGPLELQVEVGGAAAGAARVTARAGILCKP